MKSAAVLVMAVAVVLLCSGAAEAADYCRPVELAPCLPAIQKGSAPSANCCNKLRQQQPCFCGYLKDPSLRQYIDSPNAKKVVAACHVPAPKC